MEGPGPIKANTNWQAATACDCGREARGFVPGWRGVDDAHEDQKSQTVPCFY